MDFFVFDDIQIADTEPLFKKSRFKWFLKDSPESAFNVD